MKIVDLTHDAPTHCEVCGAELVRFELEDLGEVGPEDVQSLWAQEHGLVEGDMVLTRWLGWECSRKPEEHPAGPYGYAECNQERPGSVGAPRATNTKEMA